MNTEIESGKQESRKPGTELEAQHQFPAIGKDPLKLSGQERIDYRSAEAVEERLTKALVLQQKGVPDQTALVWRDDISSTKTRLILAEARLESARRQIAALHAASAVKAAALIEISRLCPEWLDQSVGYVAPKPEVVGDIARKALSPS